ncbi:MAG: 4'-phosphopantetheinyl transferase superfamily protein [Anaerolineae bacterium]|nr:4'-phosphopantetheinyl transferase superfamily protein [Anaerolineae bacterium]
MTTLPDMGIPHPPTPSPQAERGSPDAPVPPRYEVERGAGGEANRIGEPIHWLIQRACDYPAGMLSADERAKLRTLKVDKRRADWLLGRWTIKRLLQSVISNRHGVMLPLDQLVVLNDPDGVPIAHVNGYPDLSISISHSNGHAFCAVVERRNARIGVDIERIEPRSDSFVTDYLTPDEFNQVSSAADQDTLITAIWSAKEAALKALHLGLSVDTRSLTCLISPPPGSPATWIAFGITTSTNLPQSLRTLHGEGHPTRTAPPPDSVEGGPGGAVPPLIGWWRVWHGYTLTLVTERVL